MLVLSLLRRLGEELGDRGRGRYTLLLVDPPLVGLGLLVMLLRLLVHVVYLMGIGVRELVELLLFLTW